MVLRSDLQINAARLQPFAVSHAQAEFNDNLVSLLNAGPAWYEVGAEKYRVMRNRGETPLPKTTVLDAGKPFFIPSRENGRNIPCRVMLPASEGPLKGVLMHIHGGGWVLQSESDQDPLLKATADCSGLAVISIGYRLAPENPFPKGPEDCFDAAMWLVDHGESEFGTSLKFISGESAGGHLTVLALLDLLEKRPQFNLAGVVLNFGAYDLTLLPMARNYPKPLILTPKTMDKYLEAFLPGRSLEQRKHPSISPFYKDLNSLKLPPALFTCGTEDCLLDDTIMMALRWQMTGTQTITRLFPGAPHGFVLFPPEKLTASKEYLEIVEEFLLSKL